MEADHAQEYYVPPLWSSFTSIVKSSKAKNGDEKLNKDTDTKTNKEPELLEPVVLTILRLLAHQLMLLAQYLIMLAYPPIKIILRFLVLRISLRFQGMGYLQVHLMMIRVRYVAEILKKFDFLSVKTASTPIETKKPLVKDEEADDVDVHHYRSMIGSLMYLTASRPDIMYAVCACSRFQVTPKTSHLQEVKRIFRYLKGQPKLGLWYPTELAFDLEAYSNSDYAGANLDKKSTTGGCQFLGKRLISWQ
nr:uncharacterized mitochondrial protein AtMg00810-like [Tanacetum cinerariifolium]